MLDAKNLSWAILAAGGGLILSTIGIILATFMGADATLLWGIATNCLVLLGAVMNPNKKFANEEEDNPPVLRRIPSDR